MGLTQSASACAHRGAPRRGFACAGNGPALGLGSLRPPPPQRAGAGAGGGPTAGGPVARVQGARAGWQAPRRSGEAPPQLRQTLGRPPRFATGAMHARKCKPNVECQLRVQPVRPLRPELAHLTAHGATGGALPLTEACRQRGAALRTPPTLPWCRPRLKMASRCSPAGRRARIRAPGTASAASTAAGSSD